MKVIAARATLGLLVLAGLGAAFCAPARAAGTLLIQQRDGEVKLYRDVRVAIGNDAMQLTSADHEGAIVIGKAACTKVGELVRCLPYDATLLQDGETLHVPLTEGTVWLNPTSSKQTLTFSSEQLPPRGVIMSVRTKAGTYVTLTGTVDEIHQ